MIRLEVAVTDRSVDAFFAGTVFLVTSAPAARASFPSLSTGAALPGWVRRRRAAGALVFADVGWDERNGWSRGVLGQLTDVDAFVPNEAEAMAYTGTSTARDALYALGSRFASSAARRPPRPWMTS
jgi:hypothetical protein